MLANSETCKYDPLTQRICSKKRGGGGVRRPLSSVRKAHFRDKDRLMKNSSWARWLEVGQTSANGGGRLRPIPRSTTAVIKTTAAARLGGPRLRCMCALADPPPPRSLLPSRQALHTLVWTPYHFHDAPYHAEPLIPVAKPAPFSSISICTRFNRVRYRPAPNGATLPPSQSL